LLAFYCTVLGSRAKNLAHQLMWHLLSPLMGQNFSSPLNVLLGRRKPKPKKKRGGGGMKWGPTHRPSPQIVTVLFILGLSFPLSSLCCVDKRNDSVRPSTSTKLNTFRLRNRAKHFISMSLSANIPPHY